MQQEDCLPLSVGFLPPLHHGSISRLLRQREPVMDGRMDVACRGVSPRFPLGQPVCRQSTASPKMVSLANSTANRQLPSLYISPKKNCLNLFFYMAYFIIIHIWLGGSQSSILSQKKMHEESEAPWVRDIWALAFLNDLGFNYSLYSHVALSGSSCLHPVNELSGSNNPVEALHLVHWVAGLGHLCQKSVALIFTREDAWSIHSPGEKSLLFTGDFFCFVLLLFVLFFLFLF